ncbi:MAG: hypothetical protein ABI862_14980 [Ilumatobacteraceae bacterium]
MIRSRRLALAAVVVVLGLAACGDPNTTTPLADQPQVIQLASGQLANGQGGSAAESAPAAATADSKMAFFGPTEFVYDGELPALDTPAGSWFYATGQQPDLDRISKLASALGVEGDVRTLPADQGGGWAVGPQDYSGAVLTVGSDGMLNWWLSAAPTASAPTAVTCEAKASTDPAVGTGSAGSSGVAVDVVASSSAPEPDETTPAVDVVAPGIPDCGVAQPPVGVPTKDEALAKAKQLFADWGYDAGSYLFDDPYADQWGASVNASLLLDGMKAPITLSVGFGENGVVTYASGSLAVPERGADYPTIGAAAGLERLKTQQNQYVGLAADGVSTRAAADVAIAPAIAPDIAPCEPEAGAADCTPVQTEPITVTLNSVKADLTMVWAADNTIWLLPAYSFGSADGGIYTVIAVEDAYIHQADPEVATTEPPGQDPGVVTPETAPGGEPITAVLAPDAAPAADPAATVPAAAP